MIAFPNAKINLGLNIEAKRKDGYHEISSGFLPIPFHDILEILPAESTRFGSTGLEIPGNGSDNLCLKAYYLLQKEYHLPPVHIRLHKVIPMGAGLGGGSADGAFTLRLLNKLFSLQLPERQLERFAAELGSDCPFFIRNKPAIARGRGELLSSVKVDLSGKWLKLIHPGIHVATAEAYSGVVPSKPARAIEKILEEPVRKWQANLVNDFEKSVFPKYKVLNDVKSWLIQNGALYASMTGSGSAIYGIFDQNPPAYGSLSEWDFSL